LREQVEKQQKIISRLRGEASQLAYRQQAHLIGTVAGPSGREVPQPRGWRPSILTEPHRELAPFHSDHLVGAGEQCWRDIETERLRSLEVDDQLELGGLLDGKVCGARLRGSRLPLNSVARVKKSPAEAGQDTKRVENTPA
jgi:hypothetical protein